MNKTEKILHSPATAAAAAAQGDLHRVVVDSVEQRGLCLIKIRNTRRRRLKLRERKYCFRDGDGKRLSDDFDRNVKEVELKNGRNSTSDSVFLSLSSSSSSKSNNVAFVETTATEATLLDLEKNHGKESEDFDAKRLSCVSYGLISVIGRRREMEDAARVELGFIIRENEKYDFFGVYDGHGGARVAQACENRLHRFLAEEILGGGGGGGAGVEWEKVMERCFVKMDDEVVSCGGETRTMGSTAVVAVVGKAEVVVANCGDSRAVMSRNGVAVALSNDHKPNRPDELERIEATGGKVINWNGHRVLGVLATSRSIGDQYLKPYVISRPEVTIWARDGKDEFLILATDGLWDVVSNEIACEVVKNCLDSLRKRRRRRKNQNGQDRVMESSDAAKAAAALTNLAMNRGSNDNISVIVVDLSDSRLSPTT